MEAVASTFLTSDFFISASEGLKFWGRMSVLSTKSVTCALGGGMQQKMLLSHKNQL